MLTFEQKELAHAEDMKPVAGTNEATESSTPASSLVQNQYEKTLEESERLLLERTASEQLAQQLKRGLRIRRSADQRVIRSPSARKIGAIRRRSSRDSPRASINQIINVIILDLTVYLKVTIKTNFVILCPERITQYEALDSESVNAAVFTSEFDVGGYASQPIQSNADSEASTVGRRVSNTKSRAGNHAIGFASWPAQHDPHWIEGSYSAGEQSPGIVESAPHTPGG